MAAEPITGRLPAGRKRVRRVANLDGVVAALGALHIRAERQRARMVRARERAAADALAAERLRGERTTRWPRKRACLLAVVVEIDAALAPHGCALSLVDEDPHPADTAAVEVRLSRHGRSTGAWLDITVDADGGQRVNGETGGVWRPLEVSPLRYVTVEEYRGLLLTWLEAALLHALVRAAEPCRGCRLRPAAIAA